MYIDLSGADADWRRAYKLCIGFIAPRPIALVSSVSAAGAPNLAPFSFYNMVCARPPTVIFACGIRRDGSDKDTFRNVETTGEFVVATATTEICRAMVDCAADLPYGQSEFAFSGLTPTPATHVRAPLVKEALVNIECKLHQVVRLGDGAGGAHVVFGRILAVHLADEVVSPDGEIDPHRLVTVGRLGAANYCDAAQPYAMKIPTAGPDGTRR